MPSKNPTEEQKQRHRESSKRWKEKNRDKVREYKKAYYSGEEGRLRRKNEVLQVMYGITLEQYEELLLKQGGVCAICGASDPCHGHRYFCVDHDHNTGDIRGILCHYCNRGMGFLGDSVEKIDRVLKYLKQHKESNACKPTPSTQSS